MAYNRVLDQIFQPETYYEPDTTTQRLRGAYYTPRSAADYMADWLICHDGEHILEPSFGNGIFLRAVTASATYRDLTHVRLSGVEIDERARVQAIRNGYIAAEDAQCADFLQVSPFKVQAVIGNPPYVRLRHLPTDQRQSALQATYSALGQAMDPSGSLWMPFVLHAMSFLSVGGRLAFVLPYEFTYVKYARPLWDTLRNNFGSLQVLRTHERLFPDLLQDVVILLADDYGSATETVLYQAFERVQDMLEIRPVVNATLQIDSLIYGERSFISALLSDELRQLLDTHIKEITVAARELITFNIGYVTGDKTFFHPTTNDIFQYQLPWHSLYPALVSTRMLKNVGLRSSSLDATSIPKLFLPNPKKLSAGEERYIANGEELGISARYKCRVRKPWYVVPDTRVPDVVLSVFSERPVLLINDAGCFASNSLLCGYCKATSREEVVTGWYTSLTLLQCELEVHALGGGVMVMVPREAGNIRLPRQVHPQRDYLDHLDRLLRQGDVSAAYQSGDQHVLRQQLGLSANDIDLLRTGIKVLAHWRTSARSSLK